MRKVALIIAMLALCVFAREPAPSPSDYTLDLSKYGFIDTSLNKIQFPKGNKSFEPFFKKLDTLVFENRGKVRILHIGGSHIQADVMSGRIREHLVKEYPGASAGRGFVFPFSAAKTNTPSSYGSMYKGIWDMSKNVLREVKKPLGLLGIAVSTSDPRAEFSILLNRYNPQPIWSETRVRLFGYSDNGDVIPVLHVDSTEIPGKLDSATQSFTFPIPHPIDSIVISFRWLDSLQQAEIARFITDSLRQDSIARAAALADSLAKDSLARKDSSKKKTSLVAIPDNVALPLDSMFQDSSVIDTALDEPPPFEPEPMAPLDVSSNESKPGRPRFTITGIYTESDAPGIMYTNVGINGAKVPNYFETVCPNFEKELAFLKPDLVIFAIGINDANVDRFDDKGFYLPTSTRRVSGTSSPSWAGSAPWPNGKKRTSPRRTRSTSNSRATTCWATCSTRLSSRRTRTISQTSPHWSPKHRNRHRKSRTPPRFRPRIKTRASISNFSKLSF